MSSTDTNPIQPLLTSASQTSRGIRETIESIAIALALAFLFKTFQAEAYVIPTGSMAPTLMGRHKDVICPECRFHYTASASDEADRNGNEKNDSYSEVVSCTCPNCRFPMSVDPTDEYNAGRFANPSYSGDRIWVSKVPYQFSDPKRWDVIVFRFPEEAETYYIKRLVGLPNETIKIRHGDIYTKGPDDTDFVIQRKGPEKLRAMAQIVHDNDFVSPALAKHDWPVRWKTWSDSGDAGGWKPSEDTRSYRIDGGAEGESWLRYQHIVPGDVNWHDDRWPPEGRARPQLITDFYAFNTRVLRHEYGPMSSTLGLHWVGDLILDCELDALSSTGAVLLDLVKGGKHFRCSIDLASGEAAMTIDGLSDWRRSAATSVRGKGKHQLMFANADRQLVLWVDDQVVNFNEATSYPELDNESPRAGGDADPGDLAPAGIGSRGAALAVNHLRILRDIYYIADKSPALSPITDYRNPGSIVPRMNADELADFMASADEWESRSGGNVFDRRQEVVFPLGPDEFFVLGDNSPASSDARLWSRQHFVERDLLVGKALFIYWPHPLRVFIPFTDKALGVIPNVPEMGFIR